MAEYCQILPNGQAKFWIGMFAGATMTAYIALRDSPPFHIEKWGLGQEGERRTAKALGRLRAEAAPPDGGSGLLATHSDEVLPDVDRLLRMEDGRTLRGPD